MLVWLICSHDLYTPIRVYEKKLEIFFLLNVLNSFRWSCKLNSLLKVSFFFVAWEERSLSNQVVYLKPFFLQLERTTARSMARNTSRGEFFALISIYFLRYF